MSNKLVSSTLLRNKLIWIGSIFTIFAGVSFWLWPFATVVYEAKPVALTDESSVAEEVSAPVRPIYFTGDVMLGRHVERLLAEKLIAPTDFETLFASSSQVVVNFESAMAEQHERTPSGGMRFSVTEENLEVLRRLSVSHASLANNHSRDYGKAGHAYANASLRERRIEAFGDAVVVASTSIVYLEQGDMTIGVIGLHTLFFEPSREVLAPLFKEMTTQSDVQFAYVHWGNEYEPVHSATQERFANLLIELGADAIIGHHPHVTQDIALIAHVPVFYSLGNFIFDQYWQKEVTEGYVLGVAVGEESIQFTLLPHEQCRLSTPCTMPATTSQRYLSELAARSAPALYDQIMAKNIVISR